jgi:hypothetical protein
MQRGRKILNVKKRDSTTQQSNRIEDDKRQEARRIDHKAGKHPPTNATTYFTCRKRILIVLS